MRLSRLHVFVPLLLAILVAEPVLAEEPAKPAFGAWGIETQHVSPTVQPGDDFFAYVNEGWLKTATIPPGLSSQDEGIAIYFRTADRVKEIITGLAAAPPPTGTPAQRVADLYQSYVDAARLQALGLSPLRADLDTIMAIETREALVRVMADPLIGGGPIGGGVLPDPGNPRRSLPLVVQGGLTLPTRDFYLEAGEPFATLRAALRGYIAEMLKRAAIDDPEGNAERILALETRIAEAHWSVVELRDRLRLYHLMSPKELADYAPGFQWDVFLRTRGYADRPAINVNTDTAIRRLAVVYAETPIETWRAYLAFHLLDGWADFLSADWQDTRFAFKRLLSGQSAPLPRDQDGLLLVGAILGDDVGQLYVARYFPPSAKAAIETLVGYIRAAFRERLQANGWMDEATRKEAIAKLDRIVEHIGYPDRYRDFSSIAIDPADLAGNIRRVMAWAAADDLKRLDEPARDWEWALSAQDVNANYSATLNSINFPAGFLQPPNFDPAADPAVNFGAIGAVIGHELGHAFDDQGSRSDGEGRLRDWWTPAARAEFERRAAMLVRQYDAYEALPGVPVSGALTLGENIGDLGGLSIAYIAYRRYVAEQYGGEAPVLDGYTGDQRFFMSWAQMWRNIMLPDEARRMALSDPHSPSQFRVNGVVRNIDAWYAAFGVKEDDALYLKPEERVRIW
jgi:endothelin-converting enzyme/putative endopeptidase